LDEAKGVDVLEFDARPELRFPLRANGDVCVTAEAPLLKVSVVHAGRNEDLAERLHVGDRLRARAQVGLADDLDERSAGAIQINSGVVPDTMHVLPRVLLHVNTRDAGALHFAAELVLEMARGAVGT